MRQIYTYDPVPGVKQWTQLRIAGQEDLKEPDHQTILEKIKAKVSPGRSRNSYLYLRDDRWPKGVMLSHANLVTNCLATATLVQSAMPERALSFLPLCHIYERTLINIYVYLGTSVFLPKTSIR